MLAFNDQTNEAEMSFPQLHPAAAPASQMAILIRNKIIAGMNDCLSVSEIANSIASMITTPERQRPDHGQE